MALCKAGLVLAVDNVDAELRASIMKDLEALGGEASTVASHPKYKKILHLVHPSLYAYEKGVTHVLANTDASATASPPMEPIFGT